MEEAEVSNMGKKDLDSWGRDKAQKRYALGGKVASDKKSTPSKDDKTKEGLKK